MYSLYAHQNEDSIYSNSFEIENKNSFNEVICVFLLQHFEIVLECLIHYGVFDFRSVSCKSIEIVRIKCSCFQKV